MVTSFVSFWDAYWLIVIVNRIGKDGGWQEKNGLLTCPCWVGTTAKVERYFEN